MSKEHAPQPSRWLVVRRYRDEPAALNTYEVARDLLFTEDLDASVFRFTLDGVCHVAVVGETPFETSRWRTMLTLLDAEGEQTQLPDEASERLWTRRHAFKATGADYLERRTTRDSTNPPHP
jgi:hypothetical protein